MCHQIYSAFVLLKGWRAIWVRYLEALLKGPLHMTSMRMTAPVTNRTTHPFYIDALRMLKQLRQQSRDKVVPTFEGKRYPPISEKSLWQQTYRWSQVSLRKT